MSAPDPVINPRAYRHYRRRYSLAEFRWGMLALAGLGGIAAWVIWKGGQVPKRGVLSLEPATSASAMVPVQTKPAHNSAAINLEADEKPPPERRSEPAASPLPPGTAPVGWQGRATQHFSTDNLYVKINGRAGFFKSRGFQGLWFTSWKHSSGENIDLELYDMGSAPNARGVYAAERNPAVAAQSEQGGLWHLDRNALFLARGRFYVRLLGSAESPVVVKALEELRRKMTATFAAGSLRTESRLLVEDLGIPEGSIEFEREAAFSIECAQEVTIAPIVDPNSGAKPPGEYFLMPASATLSPEQHASCIQQGLADIGKFVEAPKLRPSCSARWIKNNYLDSFSGVCATLAPELGERGAIAGVRDVPTLEGAGQALQRLVSMLKQGSQ